MITYLSPEPIAIDRHPPALPPLPRRIEDTKLDFFFLVELVAKALYVRGQLRLIELSEHLKLPHSVLDPLLSFMRSERLCEIIRRGETEGTMAYSLTDLGRERAADFFRRSRYAGPAPVSLEAYVQQIQAQSIIDMGVTREKMQRVFADVVVQEGLLDQFGAAMNSGRAIFIYGPAGSGKTFISEHLVGLLSGQVAMPYAIEVDNQVIQLFDPVVHQPVTAQKPASAFLDRGRAYDERWLLCQRPVVRTGAELTLNMVDLEFDDKAGLYQAPPQVKANNGLFIIDDLGRQLVSAQDLMNRWIVPLDRRIDYLSLHTGKKFQLPFDVLVVFSSNIAPSDLADEAFLRRLGYKIFVGAVDEALYRRIVIGVCEQMEIPFNEEGYHYLVQELHTRHAKPLLACVPRDLLSQIKDIARLKGEKSELSPSLLDWAWNNYFARH